MRHELAIIGAGNMAEAIARGLLRGKLLAPSTIIAADVSAPRRELFQRELGIDALENARQAVHSARVILLSVKPQQMAEVLKSLAPAVAAQSLALSIVTGVSTRFIAEQLGGENRRVIRAMPNTPMLLGEGMVALAGGEHATPADMAMARSLFQAAATVIEVGEDKLDAVTAVSGSGPAYFFYLAEQMIRAAVELGLSPDQAKLLVTRTAVGAARMLADSGDTADVLRRKVTSPGGTTNAAITRLDAQQWPAATVDAIKAAAARSKELSL